ncbi:MAG: hypothetical protein M1838_005680 [Thelocarpon superellum]|nr:MAG: hypothetical protein M1838_005680 [Thelocarpon superellum]
MAMGSPVAPSSTAVSASGLAPSMSGVRSASAALAAAAGGPEGPAVGVSGRRGRSASGPSSGGQFVAIKATPARVLEARAQAHFLPSVSIVAGKLTVVESSIAGPSQRAARACRHTGSFPATFEVDPGATGYQSLPFPEPASLAAPCWRCRWAHAQGWWLGWLLGVEKADEWDGARYVRV